MGERYLVLACPWWPLLAAGVDRDRPAVTIEANRVAVASPGAVRMGVAPGLRRREAESRCPALTLVPADPAQQAREFEKVLRALDGFTPFIEILQPGTCLFATRGCVRYFGGEAPLAHKVLEAVTSAVRQPGCFGLGVADGLFTAGVAARRSLRDSEPVLIDPGESAAFLAPQPVALLGRPELSDLLRRLGLRTLGAFAGLPTADVLARFGPDGLQAHRQASGADEHRLAPREPQAVMELSEEIDPPTDRCDIAVFAGKGLADRLAGQLEAQVLGCNKVVIEATTEDGQSFSRTWRLDGGFSPGAIAQRVRWQLEGWLSGSGELAPASGLARLTLVPQEVTANPGVQLSFWGGRTEPGRRAVRGVARLLGLLGPEAVVVAEYRGGRGADRYRTVSAGGVDLLDRPAVPAHASEAPWPGHLPAPSPALTFADTGRRRVGVLDAAGRSLGMAGDRLSGDPARLVLDGERRLEVAGWSGPWPVDERWWDPAARRQLVRLQVSCAGHAAYLVAYEKESWWLEAAYD